MSAIRYDVVPNCGGWGISCNAIVGPPYLTRSAAIRDMLWSARMLEASGAEVIVGAGDESAGEDPSAPAPGAKAPALN
jgi:hypothetical protein